MRALCVGWPSVNRGRPLLPGRLDLPDGLAKHMRVRLALAFRQGDAFRVYTVLSENPSQSFFSRARFLAASSAAEVEAGDGPEGGALGVAGPPA